jgi:hypothetical protein
MLLAGLAFPVCRSATSTVRRLPRSIGLGFRVVNEGHDGLEVRVGKILRQHAFVDTPGMRAG